mgnify:CR=1 FL=1
MPVPEVAFRNFLECGIDNQLYQPDQDHQPDVERHDILVGVFNKVFHDIETVLLPPS